MALELLSHYRKNVSELRLVPAREGRFEVSIDRKLIFSKLREGRFPEPGELKELIGTALGS